MSKRFLSVVALVFALLILPACKLDVKSILKNTPEKKVKLDFYVMSQCPYGMQVEEAIAPVMQKMGDITTLNINYIVSSKQAGANEESCVDDLCSLHGAPEVKGDIVQLCVDKIVPEKSLDFILCQNKTVQEITTNWEACAKGLGFDAEKIRACYDGDEGKTLLRENKLLADKVKAEGSPTIYLNDKSYEGGRSSLDFQRALCQAVNNEHEACKKLPACDKDLDCQAEPTKVGKCISPNTPQAKCEYAEPTQVSLIILSDKRCTQPECQQNAQILAQIQKSFKGVENVKELDYASPEGKDFYTKNKIKLLPAFLFDKNVAQAYFYNDLKQYLAPQGEYYLLAIPAVFDPTKEICDNKIDDTGNGLIDCKDTDCQTDFSCRQEVKGKLDLFVMSQCPYGILALNTMPTVLDAFKNEIDFKINYIAQETAPGQFNSLHGQGEVDEDIRELCVAKYYPENNQYLDYILCRNKDIQNSAWEKCATDAKTDAAKIKTCSTGTEGTNLLSENIKLGNDLQIGASPTWVANNNSKFGGIDAQTVQKEICKVNPDLAGCKADLSQASSGASAVPAGNCGK